jgi:hypothetical protein
MSLNFASTFINEFRCLERHDAVLIEQRSEDGKTLEKLWVATAKDTFKLMK